MLMLGVLPPHCLWYAPKESTSACKRPAAASPEEHWQTNFRDLRRWLSTHLGDGEPVLSLDLVEKSERVVLH